MLKGIKKILGIEGIVVELNIPEELNTKVNSEIHGTLNLHAKGDSKITGMEFRLVEKYKRGRKESKLIDEYTLGKVAYNEDIELKKGQSKEFPFILPFKLMQSEMDELERSNFLLRGIVGVAKMIKGAKSDYRVDCVVNVEGTKLHPHATSQIVLK